MLQSGDGRRDGLLRGTQTLSNASCVLVALSPCFHPPRARCDPFPAVRLEAPEVALISQLLLMNSRPGRIQFVPPPAVRPNEIRAKVAHKWGFSKRRFSPGSPILIQRAGSYPPMGSPYWRQPQEGLWCMGPDIGQTNRLGGKMLSPNQQTQRLIFQGPVCTAQLQGNSSYGAWLVPDSTVTNLNPRGN